jgi:hypothetical protein
MTEKDKETMIVNCVVSTVTMTEKDKERNGCNVKGLR